MERGEPGLERRPQRQGGGQDQAEGGEESEVPPGRGDN